MRLHAVLIAVGLVAGVSQVALAQDVGQPPTEMVLQDGTVHRTPGAMFQYLRDRDNGLANGNPKAIVDAYPDEFENVGDLIDQRREDVE